MANPSQERSTAPSLPQYRHFRPWGRLGRVNKEPATLLLNLAAPVIRGLSKLAITQQWAGTQNIPTTGPAIITPNHISSSDPLLIAHFLAYNGRWPHFLARANLFDHRLLGAGLRHAEQIPVYRGTDHASDALVAAKEMLDRGGVVVIYPEGTITFDPLEWPMTMRSGAARLALETGVPVIPVGQWGANYFFPPRKIRPFDLKHRHRERIVAGSPVDLADLLGREDDHDAVHEATWRIHTAVTAQVELARGEVAPDDVWDSRIGERISAPGQVQ